TDSRDLVIKTNATEAMRVTSAGAIGIGTAMPSEKLNVSNGNFLLSHTGPTSDTLQFQGTSTGSSNFIAGAQGATTVNYTLPTSQPISNQTLTATSISGSGPYNVSLSWTSPATVDTGWGRWGNSGTTPGTNFLGTTDNEDLVIKTNATEAMRVTSAGAIGIGTSTPSNKLDIANGNLSLSRTGAASDTLKFQGTSTGSSNFIAGAQGATTVNYTLPTSQPGAHQVLAATSIAGMGPYNVALGWSTPISDTGWGTTGNSGTTAGTNFLGTTDDQDLVIKTNSAEVMRVSTWGDVGIGTSSPSQRLSICNGNIFLSRTGWNGPDVVQFEGTSTGTSSIAAGAQGTTSIEYTLPTSAPTTNQVLTAASVTGTTPYQVALAWTSGTTADSGWGLWGNSGTTPGTNFLGTTDNKDLVIKTNATEALRVTSAGAIGIGTTTPSEKLNVSNGNFLLSHTGATSDTLQFQGTSTGSSNFIAGMQGATTVNYTLPTSQPSANQVLTATNVTGTGPYIVTLNWSSPTGGTGWGLTGNSGTTEGTNFIGTTDNADLVFKTNSTEAMRIENTGEIGIGTNMPTAKVEISNGDLFLSRTGSSTDALKFQGTSTGTSSFTAGAQGTTSIAYTLPTAAPVATGNLLWTTSGTSSAMGWSTGLVWDNTDSRLGIGTTSPADALQSVYSGTTDEYAAIQGTATGSTSNQSIGLWGSANSTSTSNTGTIGVLATGNGNTTAGNTNVALQINDGEFTMGRTTETPSAGTDVDASTGGTAYSQQGPSGVVELTLGALGNLATSAPTSGTMQDLGSVTIDNRYCESGSIVLTNVVAMIDDGSAPNPQDAAWILNVASTTSGSFVLRIKMIPATTSASNYSTSDKIRVGYVIVNKSK
ncbi:MAG TPA: hypothetical protein VFH95_10655, partial [Candidatus Kapabacteria bacterium]|nr:hypothetical protein [Candidatus Kapabacteria bacterium]